MNKMKEENKREGLEHFLKTTTDKEKLKIALEVIREYKSNESTEEWAFNMFATWVRLEELEKYLETLTNNNE